MTLKDCKCLLSRDKEILIQDLRKGIFDLEQIGTESKSLLIKRRKELIKKIKATPICE